MQESRVSKEYFRSIAQLGVFFALHLAEGNFAKISVGSGRILTLVCAVICLPCCLQIY
jgi:hypothetical protein